MRKTILTTITALSLGVLTPAWVQAASILCDFTGDPSANGFTFSGSTVWVTNGTGNPGGFVQLTDAIDDQAGSILLPDFDHGTIISGFTVSMDIRVGAGTDTKPAEGWSINFVPATADCVANGVAAGWASDFAGTPNVNQPSRGSTQGLGVYSLNCDHGGADILGFNVRYNQVQFNLGGFHVPPAPAPPVFDGACADTNSLQTGPTGGGDTALCWAKFTMTMHDAGLLDISWKGTPVVTNFPTGWTPQSGVWILGAQTSDPAFNGVGGNEVHEFDNISITTTAASKPIISSFSGGPTGFGYDIQDIPGAAVNLSTVQLTLDGAPVTPALSNKSGTNSVVTYNHLLTNGTHTATISFNSTLGVNETSTNKFTVVAYTATPVSASYATTGIDTSKVGFKVRPYQTVTASPNNIAWSEGQLAGLYGTNIADLSLADAQGYFYQNDYINYNINVGAPIGDFQPPDYNQYAAPGIPGMIPGVGQTTGNFAEEILAWLYFPSAGAFMMGVNSDDGFKVSTSATSVSDPNGLILGEFNAGRGAADTMFYLSIPAAGYYPFRLLWFNGPGELPGNLSSCEWFIQREDGTKILLNDTTKPGAIAAYYGGPAGLPYVQTFSGTLQGFSYVVFDGASSVASGSIQTAFNGASVTPVVTYDAATRATTINYNAPAPLPSPSTNVVVLSFQNSGAPVITQTVTNTFVVSGTIIPPGIALSSGVHTDQPGFAIRTYESTNVEPNAIWWAEMQLAGLQGPNIAPDLSSSTNGWWTNTDVVNYDATGASATLGNFHSPTYPDYYFPGQDTTLTTFDNSSAEILAWVNFPVPGTYTMGVYDDDGFKMTLGANPRDMFAYLVGQYVGVTTTTFQFYIPQGGYYPMRLVWENGTGGCSLEWFSVQADGSYVLINDALTPGSLKAYAAGPTYPTKTYVSLLKPGQQETGISPDTGVFLQFTDGATQVDPTSIKVWIDGQSRAVTASKTGLITTANAAGGLIPSGETATARLVYNEIGNATPITNTWQFTVTTYSTLPVGLASPLGSGTASKPGFRVRAVEIPQWHAPPAQADGGELPDQVAIAEQILAGLWGTAQALTNGNVADLSQFTDNGYYDLASVVNLSGNNAGTELGYFTSANGYPDSGAPGMPGSVPTYWDQYAAEFLTYVEFPAAGLYTMGVASDDNFRVTPVETNSFIADTLYVNAPAAIAGVRIGGVRTWSSDGGYGPLFPTTPPMTGKVVYASPATGGGPPPVPLDNAADIAGNIALIDRGAIEFGCKTVDAQLSGAIACIIAQNRADPPITLGAGTYGAQATIPTVMISQNDTAILKAHLADPGGVMVTVGSYPGTILGQADAAGGRGTGETSFQFGVTQPGVYPLRLTYNNGGGAFSCEWYSIDASGNRTLLNDTVAGALKAYRARTVTQPPSLSIARSGASVVLTFQGTLTASGTVNGTYTNVVNAVSPYTNAPSGTLFFRAYR